MARLEYIEFSMSAAFGAITEGSSAAAHVAAASDRKPAQHAQSVSGNILTAGRLVTALCQVIT